jgi:hypothetical protein
VDVDLAFDESSNGIDVPSYTETFERVFPFFLSIGMTYESFWLEDMKLTRYYVEADDINDNRKNNEAWLQGMYFYEAIMSGFSTLGKKKYKYPEKPYDLGFKDKIMTEREKEIEEAKKAEAWMNAFTLKFKDVGKEGGK